MGTGISMSSVNKIKELAESGDYSLALDILEHQDLTRSLSPQFIKICGEVYFENGRYAEARASLVKAHSMAPVGNKIIFSLIKVYLSMGYYSLADTYYDIYKFNQNEKDAGTYRIEYLIAKAQRKSYKELYSILISANEMETNAEWDFEMLMLYAALEDWEKLDTESEIFCATYKGSPYIEKVNKLKDRSYDIVAAIYCYPEQEVPDDDEKQNETRAFEKQVLEADDLRLHPRDPKITLMVEDREPVPNSVKFKQMLLKSREKKEEKKQQKREKQEKEKEQQPEKGKHFRGIRMSKKDEEAVEEVLAETGTADIDKDKLLDEVLDSTENQEDAATVIETGNTVPEQTDVPVEMTSDKNESKSLDQLSEDSFEEGIDDFEIQLDNDFDTVVIVNPEVFDEFDEIEEPEKTEQPEEIAESEEPAEPEKTEEPEESVSETADEEPVEESWTPEESTEPEKVEEPEAPEMAEEAESPETPEMAEHAEYLKNNEIVLDDASLEDKANSEFTSDEFDIDVAIQSLDDYKFDTEAWDEDSFEQAYEDDDIVEIPEDDATFAESEEETVFAESEEPMEDSEDNTTFAEPEDISEDEAIFAESERSSEDLEDNVAFVEPEEISEDETVFVDVEEPMEDSEENTAFAEPEEISEEETVFATSEEPTEDETVFTETEEVPEKMEDDTAFSGPEATVEPKKNTLDFPVFRSSLFPDYNSGQPPVVEHVKHDVDMQEEYDLKMADNLKKEEALISETDELLARLGIELGTKYAANTDYFNLHGDSFVHDVKDDEEQSINESEHSVLQEGAATEEKSSEHTEKKDEKKYKLKRK